MNLAFLNIGSQEMILIVIVILLLFGGKKLPELARGLGRGIREFKDASEGIKREIADQINNFDKDLEPAEDKTKDHVKEEDVVVQNEVQQPVEEDTAKEKKTFPQFAPPAHALQHNPNGSQSEGQDSNGQMEDPTVGQQPTKEA